MRYSATFLEADLDRLLAHLTRSSDEEAAYLQVAFAATETELRLLVRSVVPVPDADVESRSPVHLSIRSLSYVQAIRDSQHARSAFAFVHSHPKGPSAFSGQDDSEEPHLFALAHARNPQHCHASFVYDCAQRRLVGRIWLPNGRWEPIDVIRSIGTRWQFWRTSQAEEEDISLFDRQVLAFGEGIQRELKHLHLGVVGAGGTGSAVVEQLIRLGVGKLTVIDHDTFDTTNVNRVFGSGVSDKDTLKVDLAARQGQRIAVGTTIKAIPKHLSHKDAAQSLVGCDVIFSCTDDEWGRSILTKLTLYYIIPVVDVGVFIDADKSGGRVRSIVGGLTILQPGYPCLYCLERVTPDGVRDESIRLTDPERATQLIKEGYLAGRPGSAPSVVSFTSAMASAATTEFLDRLVGFKDQDAKGTQYLIRFDADAIKSRTPTAKGDCFCQRKSLWGAGDRKLFLDLTWRQS